MEKKLLNFYKPFQFDIFIETKIASYYKPYFTSNTAFIRICLLVFCSKVFVSSFIISIFSSQLIQLKLHTISPFISSAILLKLSTYSCCCCCFSSSFHHFLCAYYCLVFFFSSLVKVNFVIFDFIRLSFSTKFHSHIYPSLKVSRTSSS